MRIPLMALCAMIGITLVRGAPAAEAMIEIPAWEGTVTEAAASKPGATQTAVLAGGCFWGVQAVFQHLKGVTRAESGYAGGSASDARYEIVGSGRTGHAEVVRVSFDPAIVSYAHILQVFFSVAHDPTQLNRQGPDIGTQYRSAIFPLDEEQSRIAKDYIAQLNRARVFKAAIVTKIEPGKTFHAAEDYHQDFLARNPRHPYIVVHDLPKLAGLRRFFPDDYRAEPVLMRAASARR